MKNARCSICDYCETNELNTGFNQIEYEGKNRVRLAVDIFICDDCTSCHSRTMKSFEEDNDRG